LVHKQGDQIGLFSKRFGNKVSSKKSIPNIFVISWATLKMLYLLVKTDTFTFWTTLENLANYYTNIWSHCSQEAALSSTTSGATG